jgi:hypothetical protein
MRLSDWTCGVPAAACFSARTMALRAMGDLEVVVALAFGAGEQPVGECRKGLFRCRLAGEFGFRQAVAPRLVGDAAERHAHVDDHAVLNVQCCSDRDEREGIGEPVAQLQVAVMGCEVIALQPDGNDDLAVAHGVVALGVVAGQTVEIGEGNVAPAFRALDFDHGCEGGERHAHVRRVGGDAVFAGAEDGVDAVDAADRAAAGAGVALVAGRRGVVEIVAAGPLQEVSAGRGGVPELRRGAGEDGAGEQRKALGDRWVIGKRGVGDERADAQRPIRHLLDLLQRQAVDVDDRGRALDIIFHQVDEIGAAGKHAGRRVGGKGCHGIAERFDTGIGKGPHSAASRMPTSTSWSMTSWIASAILV